MSKKLFFLLAVLLTASCYVHAQVSFGVRAGLNLSNWMDDDYNTLTFKPGFQAGVVADIAFNEFLSLQPGLQFSQMGAQEKEDGDAVIMTLNYLQFPVNLQVKLGDFFVQAGPYLGYGLNVKGTIKSGGIKVSASESFDDSGLKSIDLGMGAGFGYQFGPMQAALSTQFGLSNISDEYSDIKNLGVALTLTYFFGK